MGKLMCYVGMHPKMHECREDLPSNGGIAIFQMDPETGELTREGYVDAPVKAGCLYYSKEMNVLYAGNESKAPGRGEIEKGARVYAYAVDKENGALNLLNSVRVMGTNTIDVVANKGNMSVYTATHGSGEHVEKIVQDADGKWRMELVYDDACVAQYAMNEDGSIGEVTDVDLHMDRGPDPNPSPQKGGHSQCTGHAHCVTVDPTGKYLLTGDKGCDRLYVYRIGKKLEKVSIWQFEEYTGARHVAFDAKVPGRFYLTMEFSSQLAAFDLSEYGQLKLLDIISTRAKEGDGRNEPSTLRCSADGKYIYVVNRGEDTIVTITADEEGKMKLVSSFDIDRCPDPGLGTRQIELSPNGKFLLVAERPSYKVRVLRVDDDGTLSDTDKSLDVNNPVFIQFAQL